MSKVVLPINSDLTNNESLQINTLRLSVLSDYITGVPVQCVVLLFVSDVRMLIRSSSATLTAYGKI